MVRLAVNQLQEGGTLADLQVRNKPERDGRVGGERVHRPGRYSLRRPGDRGAGGMGKPATGTS